MIHRNEIRIGKALGNMMEVENGSASALICRRRLWIREELDTWKPLVPGFHPPRPGRNSIRIQFKYERFVDYCMLCELIGHKQNPCPAPPIPFDSREE